MSEPRPELMVTQPRTFCAVVSAAPDRIAAGAEE